MIERKDIKEFDIKSKEDVRAFETYMLKELKVNYHPDDPIDEYVEYGTNKPIFSPEAAAYLQAVNDKCLEVAGEDCYRIGIEIMDGTSSEEEKDEFEEGDVLKVKPEFLDKGEDPDTEYYVVEAYDDRVKVVSYFDNFIGYLIHTWPSNTMYKVGHLNPATLKKKISKPDTLANRIKDAGKGR